VRKGGPGLGQGRKPLPPGEKKKPLTVRIHPRILDWLAEEADSLSKSRAEIIEEALRDRMEREGSL